MPKRRNKFLVAVMVVFLAGFSCQVIPVDHQASCSVSSRAASGPNDENQSAEADDDFKDASDGFELLHGIVNTQPSVSLVASSPGHQTAICRSYSSVTATLEAQHILLRL
jgi:hypothetical protein